MTFVATCHYKTVQVTYQVRRVILIAIPRRALGFVKTMGLRVFVDHFREIVDIGYVFVMNELIS